MICQRTTIHMECFHGCQNMWCCIPFSTDEGANLLYVCIQYQVIYSVVIRWSLTGSVKLNGKTSVKETKDSIVLFQGFKSLMLNISNPFWPTILVSPWHIAPKSFDYSDCSTPKCSRNRYIVEFIHKYSSYHSYAIEWSKCRIKNSRLDGLALCGIVCCKHMFLPQSLAFCILSC